METQLQQISDLQKKTWNQSSPGWKKWDELTMEFLKPVGDEIIRMLNPKGDEQILDIATGTGEPGLTIATMLNRGKVVITDLSEGMLEIARENAVKRGISNLETKVCDVSELPFDDNTFDAISCRMGFMFFPDMFLALKEMTRVLKPGGQIAVSVWNGPEKNFWFTAAISSVNKHLALPTPPAGAPGMFRCAGEGLMTDLFTAAGLKNIFQKDVSGELDCGTVDVYWGFASEVVGPVVNALSTAEEDLKHKIKTEIYKTINDKFPDGNVAIEFNAKVLYAKK